MDYQQQDCQEFLRFLLDGISEDLCRKSDSLCTPAKSGRLSFSSSDVSLPQSHATPAIVEGVRRVSMRSPSVQSSAATAVSMLNGQSKSSSVMKLRAEVALNSPDGLRNSAAAVSAGGAALNNVFNNQEYEVVNHLSKAGTGLKSARPTPTISDSTLTNRADEYQHQHQSVALSPGSSSNLSDNSVVSSNQTVHVVEARESGDRAESNTNPSVANQAAAECPESAVLSEARKAWKAYLRLNNSIVTDIFAGLLQSTVECLTCHNRYSRTVYL